MLKKDGPSGELPITVDDAVAHCRAPDDGSDDVVIEGYLRAAIAYVEDHCGITYMRQDFVLERPDWWGDRIEIPVFPVRDITAVKYFDENGAEQTVPTNQYRWSRTSTGAELRMLSAFTRPTLQDERTDVARIFIEAGYDIEGETGSGDETDLLPEPLARQCVLMLTEHWYENRSATDSVNMQDVPLSVQSLLAKLRIYR
jgi:uncharacterized phiE125 gp8 family phage protein